MNSFDFQTTTYPLVVAKQNADSTFSVTDAIGTAFFVSPKILLTCWHCVNQTLPESSFYAIRVKTGETTFSVAKLTHVEQDSFGTDMATCSCEWTPPRHLSVAKAGANYGDDVWTFAYPYPDKTIKFSKPHFAISGRYLRGYITRDFYYEHPTLGISEVYELDMPAPPGSSGSPLLLRSTNDVVGMIIGETEVSTYVAFASQDADGVRTPDTLKLHAFGIAYDHDWFVRLSTSLTEGHSLSHHLVA